MGWPRRLRMRSLILFSTFGSGWWACFSRERRCCSSSSDIRLGGVTSPHLHSERAGHIVSRMPDTSFSKLSGIEMRAGEWGFSVNLPSRRDKDTGLGSWFQGPAAAVGDAPHFWQSTARNGALRVEAKCVWRDLSPAHSPSYCFSITTIFISSRIFCTFMQRALVSSVALT